MSAAITPITANGSATTSSIAATAASQPVTILGAEAVRKSYPDFFDVLKRLGGDVHVL